MKMLDSQVVHQAVVQRLSEVIDPETDMDMIHIKTALSLTSRRIEYGYCYLSCR